MAAVLVTALSVTGALTVRMGQTSYKRVVVGVCTDVAFSRKSPQEWAVNGICRWDALFCFKSADLICVSQA